MVRMSPVIFLFYAPSVQNNAIFCTDGLLMEYPAVQPCHLTLALSSCFSENPCAWVASIQDTVMAITMLKGA